MSALAVSDRDIKGMGEVDWPAWIFGGLGVVGTAGGFLLGRIRDASRDGMTAGEVKVRIATLGTEMQAMENRLVGRMASLELHREKIDEQLRQTATKADLREAFNDIKEEIRTLSNYVHESRDRYPRPS